MKEEQLRDIFRATNTSEPLSEGWPGLLRFGLAVAEAEREACAMVCDVMNKRPMPPDATSAISTVAAYVQCAEAIRERSNYRIDVPCKVESKK